MGLCSSKETSQDNVASGNTSQAKRQDQKQALKSNNTTNNADSMQLSQQQNSTSTNSSNDLDSGKVQEKSNVDNGAVANTNETANSDKEIKVLLLGSGESGKSTIVKQMKILHKNGFSKEELYEYKPFVYKNVLDCIKSVINAIMDIEPELIKRRPEVPQFNIESEDGDVDTAVNSQGQANGQNSSNEDHITKSESQDSLQEYSGEKSGRKYILDIDTLNEILDYEFLVNAEENFDLDISHKISEIYSTPEVQTFIKYQQGNFYLIDSTQYFLSDLDRLTDPNYIPSQQDILRTRKKTSGIYDFKFQMSSGLNIHMYDVGGQRSERKKWIHCFDNVTLIIFCVALSEYDQVLLEENSQNRLEESLTLFDSVVNSRWFARTSIVLFLNKIDVFADKLPYSPLENYFSDYNGGNNINKAAKYILWRFTQVNRSGLNIYPHVTQATDTSNIELVFAAVKETILENSLRDSGLL